MTSADRKLTSLKPEKKLLINSLKHRASISADKVELRLYRLFGGQIANFLHIPKTGGSAVKAALRATPETERYRIHLRGHSCRLDEIPVGDKFFFFLREPAQRFVSAFNNKKSGRRKDWQHSRIAEQTAALKRFETANHLAESLYSEDEDLCQAANSAMNSIEHVNTFYADWFRSPDYFLTRKDDALYIGFQESLASDFENLKQVLGLPDTAGLPSLNSKAANKNCQPLDKSLSVRARENLARWYADDYTFYALAKALAPEINDRMKARALG